MNEPRGSDTVVDALLCEPVSQDCTAGPVFLNNMASPGMCEHVWARHYKKSRFIGIQDLPEK
ncbi:MAG: hypothetical protein EXR34_03815 [Rhodoferax sp.]|nr:hypothetical protein [Rhodoferax sp.]